MYKKVIKRLLDIVFSGLALAVLSPVFAILAIIIRVKLGSPVIFKQERPGYKGELFNIYKFRTMLSPQTRDGRILTDKERLECFEQGVDILSDEERLTELGRRLRAMSLDELPELMNIFLGDMSFVGPRPLSTLYLPYYTAEEMKRHDVKPGLTGMAQVHGRNSSSWSERFEYDLYYVKNCSIKLDVSILFQTIKVVIKREDIGQGTERPEAFNEVRQREWDEQV